MGKINLKAATSSLILWFTFHPFPILDPCGLPRDAGRCGGQQKRFYFDQSSGQCEEFYYTGCHGNPNRFSTRTKCEETCNVIGDDSSAYLPPGEKKSELIWSIDQPLAKIQYRPNGSIPNGDIGL